MTQPPSPQPRASLLVVFSTTMSYSHMSTTWLLLTHTPLPFGVGGFGLGGWGLGLGHELRNTRSCNNGSRRAYRLASN